MLSSQCTVEPNNSYYSSYHVDTFLIFEGFHVLFSAYMFVGLSGSGSGGLVNFLSVLTNGSTVPTIFSAISMIGWGASALFGFWLWADVHRHTKKEGHTIEGARTQAIGMGVLGSMA